MSRRYDHADITLRALMEEAGVSAEVLSRRTGISAATIRAILGGRQKSVSTRNMILFARYFGKNLVELVESFA